MSPAVQFAAIDAGSNAIRLAISRVFSPHHVEELEFERVPVRLGHSVFTRRQLDPEVMELALRAFHRFRVRMDRYRVAGYRAVATSAVREARNRRRFLDRIRRETGLQLEVIDAEEEARLVRTAVFAALGDESTARLIVDLGGGSLELSLLRHGAVEASVGLPLGTVRLLETFRLHGRVSEEEVRKVRGHVLAMLQSCLPQRLDLREAVAVACGGNAEALAQIAPGPMVRGVRSMNLRLLRDRLWDILSLEPARRMKVFRVREDRADVMGVAAIVFTALARWGNVPRFLVPGVGVRQGLLRDLISRHFAEESGLAAQATERRLLAAAERFAARFGDDAEHSEQVRRLAVSLFDQLRDFHGMGSEERLVLELGARLHDIGRTVSEEAHHKHGEYLIRHGDIEELDGARRDMVACLVRYHNRRSHPDLEHKSYAALDAQQRAHVRALAALLRIADGLDRDRKQSVSRVDVEASRRAAIFRIYSPQPCHAVVLGAQRRAALFEEEFGLRASFTRTVSASKVA